MENSISLNKTDEIVMKLLHYFIVEKGYNPIILHGAKNEIWLENLNGDYEIVRIVSNYIHNDEQFDFDIYKTQQIIKKLKRKTLSFNLTSLNFFVNVGENVHIDKYNSINNIDIALVNEVEDINKYKFVIEEFPDIPNKLTFTEKGMELFLKLTKEINEKGEKDAMTAEDIFKKKTPYITYGIIAINTIMFIISFVISGGKFDAESLVKLGAEWPIAVQNGEYYRLITSAFLHAGLIHFIFNMYALYIIGPQIESFYGKAKYILIYVGSAIFGNLLSMLFGNYVSVGASGAIFGLLGSLIYFGYHYRVYLENTIKSQIIPIILINFLIGFMVPGIDSSAHLGGFVGGILISMATGVKNKSTAVDKTNGIIMSLILLAFLIYMGFIK